MSVTMHPGDCRAVLATLPDASVQCCVTSPPYFGLRAYLPDGHPDKAREIGAEPSPDAYVAELVAVFREVRRVLADSGCVFLNLGDSYAGGKTGRTDQDRNTRNFDGRDNENASSTGVPAGVQRPVPAGYKPKDLLMIPARVALALQADGWWLRSDIIWAKPNPMPESVTDRPTSAHEHVFLLSKRASYFYDAEPIREPISENWSQGGGSTAPECGPERPAGQLKQRRLAYDEPKGANARNVWTIATQPYSGAHFATMPPELAERCIKAGTSERGQCPHCAAPWARVVERTSATDCGAAIGGDPARNDGGTRVRTPPGSLGGTVLATRRVGTDAWQPTCTCPEHKPVPQSVLDPFAGAGTTLLCADRLGRNGVGIELNPDYARLARDRITDDAPLFANVALAEVAD